MVNRLFVVLVFMTAVLIVLPFWISTQIFGLTVSTEWRVAIALTATTFFVVVIAFSRHWVRAPNVEPAAPAWRIEVEANHDAPFTVMFEPTGMTYELAGGEKMFADVARPHAAAIHIINWNGGISIWPPGSAITRDRNEVELHRLTSWEDYVERGSVDW